MLLNYLKLSLRLLIRNPFFTFINVLGLSVGLASFFILWQHSTSELMADQYHKDHQRIARIGAHWRWVELGREYSFTWGNLLSFQTALVFSDFPQLVERCRFVHDFEFKPEVTGVGRLLLFSAQNSVGKVTTLKETKVISADPNLFEFFTIPLVHGDKKTVLKNVNSVVLSKKAAARYFGAENPVNSLLHLNDTITLVVTGVFEDLPRSTHLNFEIVLSNVGHEHQWDDNTKIQWTETYIKVINTSEFEKMSRELNQAKEKYWGALLKRFPDATNPDMFIQPLKEIVFSNAEFNSSAIAVGFTPKSRAILFILQAVAVVILILAWINYVNLNVSRFSKRSKEIATRKVAGAHHWDFLKQFLVDSFVLTGISFGLAITIIQLTRQPVQIIFDIEVPTFLDTPWSTWLALAVFSASGMVFTAMYPVILSARFNPRKLQAKQNTFSWVHAFPSTLTIFQYGAALTLISWAYITYLQLTHVLEKDFLKKDQVMVVDAPMVKPKNFITNMNSFMQQVRTRYSVTFSNSIIGDIGYERFSIKRPAATTYYHCDTNGGVDEMFLPFFGIKLLEGRNFLSDEKKDAVLISRHTCNRMGFLNLADAIGTSAQIQSLGGSNSDDKVLEIIGVYEDYPLTSEISYGANNDFLSSQEGTFLTFKNEIIDVLTPERIEFLFERKDFEVSLAFIEETYRKLFPGSTFNWYFLDDQVNTAYRNEKIFRNQITLFTGLAICIACLGLLGAITNKANEKIKEIGIRKVLGASLRQISIMLLRSTIWQMIIAIAFSLPIAYYLGKNYLNHFKDQIEMQWWHFTGPVAILISILLSTVAVVLYKAAKGNPVEALKYE